MLRESYQRLHESLVHNRRVTVIVEEILRHAPHATQKMLDIGCGDGRIAAQVASKLGCAVVGADPVVRPGAVIKVEQIVPGAPLPFESNTFDLVTLTDVLHHTTDPQQVVSEAVRLLTPNGRLVIKDHMNRGWWSAQVLLAMDVVGNFGPSIPVVNRYFTESDWRRMVHNAGAEIVRTDSPIHIHRPPVSWIARSEYQCMLEIKKVS